jgi:hypothetical protein
MLSFSSPAGELPLLSVLESASLVAENRDHFPHDATE